MSAPLLEVRDLVTEFRSRRGVVRAVDGVSFELRAGETLGIVGESGSGKSVTAMSAMRLLPEPPGRVVAGQVLLEGRDLLRLPARELRRLRGKDVAMVFQDPMTSLNPVLTVGRQIDEAQRAHDRALGRAAARRRTVGLLEQVGVPDPGRRADQHPHQYSGGMRQRAMIAMAIANQPKVLIADEPTTALDTTVQAQILDLLRAIRDQRQVATILITHDLRLVAELADRVLVMYAGRVVESAAVGDAFHAPRHPYTAGLMASLPRPAAGAGGAGGAPGAGPAAPSGELAAIPGQPPDLHDLPAGCAFQPRCALAEARCATERPSLRPVGDRGGLSACHFPERVGLGGGP